MTDNERQALYERCLKLMYVGLTDELIEAGKSSRGGWSDEQLKLLGVGHPLRQGWKARLIGSRLPGSDVAAFIRLRDAHLRKQSEGQPSLFE